MYEDTYKRLVPVKHWNGEEFVESVVDTSLVYADIQEDRRAVEVEFVVDYGTTVAVGDYLVKG